MKPMPYTPFTPCRCNKTDEPHYAEQGGLMRYVGDNAAYSKHLTDAECAAHYWQAEHGSSEHAIEIEYGGAPDHDMPVTIAETWRRFFTTPHALEARDD